MSDCPQVEIQKLQAEIENLKSRVSAKPKKNDPVRMNQLQIVSLLQALERIAGAAEIISDAVENAVESEIARQQQEDENSE